MTTGENGGAAVPARLRELPSRLLGQASTQAQRLVTEALGRADAHKWHYAAMVALEESGPVSQAALSDRTGIHRSDLVAVINELAERELVERAPDPDDRRRNVITLTALGRRRPSANSSSGPPIPTTADATSSPSPRSAGAGCADWSRSSTRPRTNF
ncbi:MarR family winged helix-turn-helix transcriptional regulator [Streptomyces sp. F8]|uniref:MarR family winged helix-turn-helix transcriptional regulator n=1 Tax=Streptomyces sp. F8 TaxID=1436085 RepID=UPI0029D26407|nr:MarR family winged helix-turn-helix transcriptional regulator [Streptomyces sp. F8]MDX6759755.1 MarR family winged helix-turn-helix transcriptional regulator [Streptomyces sp. F8]